MPCSFHWSGASRPHRVRGRNAQSQRVKPTDPLREWGMGRRGGSFESATTWHTDHTQPVGATGGPRLWTPHATRRQKDHNTEKGERGAKRGRGERRQEGSRNGRKNAEAERGPRCTRRRRGRPAARARRWQAAMNATIGGIRGPRAVPKGKGLDRRTTAIARQMGVDVNGLGGQVRPAPRPSCRRRRPHPPQQPPNPARAPRGRAEARPGPGPS